MSNGYQQLIPGFHHPHKKSGPLGVLINEEVLRGMNLEEPTILIGITGIFISKIPV